VSWLVDGVFTREKGFEIVKITLEFFDDEMHLASIAMKSSNMHADLVTFSEWLRTKEKWGNHGEEAQKAVEDIRASFYNHLGSYLHDD
jgi:hypothetical protein